MKKNLNLLILLTFFFFQIFTLKAQNPLDKRDTFNLDAKNIYTAMGTYIGYNSMYSLDVDNDGTLELICSARSNYNQSGYWYILKYDSQTSKFNQIYTSMEYETYIKALCIFDYDNDGKMEVVIGLDNEKILMYDLSSKKLLNTLTIGSQTTWATINSLAMGDADNDGKNEIVVGCEEQIYFIEPSTFKIKHIFKTKANRTLIGNVDNDAFNEIVTSTGYVYQFNGQKDTLEWSYIAKNVRMCELANVDSDSKLEIIISEDNKTMSVFDVDIKAKKLFFSVNLYVDAIQIKDVNKDGINDIIYGDDQFGSIHCYDIVAKKELWKVKNPNSGVSAISYNDFDNNGQIELVWSAGANSSGADYLWVYNTVTKKILSRSSDIDTPFRTLQIGNIDGDNSKEIVTQSVSSNSGYDCGIIFAFDLQNNKQKWQSDTALFYQAWNDNQAMRLFDWNKDGADDFIVADNNLYNGRITIIDGKTKQILKRKTFTSQDKIKSLYTIELFDSNNDGDLDIVTSDDVNLYIINLNSWQVLKTFALPGDNNTNFTTVKILDVDKDGIKDVLFLKANTIGILNGATGDVWSDKSSIYNYTNFDVYDVNKDNSIDMVCSTVKGEIVVFNPSTKIFDKAYLVENKKIESVNVISIANQIGYLYTSDKRLHVFVPNKVRAVSQYLGRYLGEFESFKILNENGKIEFLFSTGTGVLRASDNFLKCLFVSLDEKISTVSCDKNDGYIAIKVLGGEAPFTYNWSNQSKADSIANLSSGTYKVTVNDKNGCQVSKSIIVENATIDANLKTTNAGCTKNGVAELFFVAGTPPYTINWSNGFIGQKNINLLAGSYSVTAKDDKNCLFSTNFKIIKDTLSVKPFILDEECNGETKGGVQLNITSGTPPFTYNWANGAKDDYIWSVMQGTYPVTITDGSGCKIALSPQVKGPDKITFAIKNSPDNPNTPNWEGKIIVENIKGGVAPYKVYWPQFNKTTILIDGLPKGSYEFIVTDALNCTVKGTAVVGELVVTKDLVEGEIQVYPNPVTESINITYEKNDFLVQINIIDINGRKVKEFYNLHDKKLKFDITNLISGTYILEFVSENKAISRRLIVKK